MVRWVGDVQGSHWGGDGGWVSKGRARYPAGPNSLSCCGPPEGAPYPKARIPEAVPRILESVPRIQEAAPTSSGRHGPARGARARSGEAVFLVALAMWLLFRFVRLLMHRLRVARRLPLTPLLQLLLR